MSGYSIKKAWSDRFIPEIKMILCDFFINVAPMEKDCNEATDLIVMQTTGASIACRVRQNNYRFFNDMTIRSKTRNNKYTEISKIIDGFGQYYFYGWADKNEEHIEKWLLGDLNVFRAHLIRKGCMNVLSNEIANGDGTWFVSFDPYKIDGFIVKQFDKMEPEWEINLPPFPEVA